MNHAVIECEKLRRLVVVLSLAGALPAQASVPITDERTLCDATSVFIGTIVDAESRDCWLTDLTKQCGVVRTIRIKIRIDSLLRNGNDLQSSKNIEADAPFLNSLPMVLLDGHVIAMNGSGEFYFSFPATGKAVETSEAREVLLDKQFAFSVHSIDPKGIYSVLSWRDIEWTKATLAKC